METLHCEREKEGEICLINQSMAIKESWTNVYDATVLGKLPESWHDVLKRRIDSLGDANVNSARYFENR